jgi:hypothetical protein
VMAVSCSVEGEIIPARSVMAASCTLVGEINFVFCQLAILEEIRRSHSLPQYERVQCCLFCKLSPSLNYVRRVFLHCNSALD